MKLERYFKPISTNQMNILYKENENEKDKKVKAN